MSRVRKTLSRISDLAKIELKVEKVFLHHDQICKGTSSIPSGGTNPGCQCRLIANGCTRTLSLCFFLRLFGLVALVVEEGSSESLRDLYISSMDGEVISEGN